MPTNTMPTDREGLILWLCESPDNVGEYLEANGGRFMAFAKARTSQVFGIQNDVRGDDVGIEAMGVLFERALTTRLLEIKGPVENWMYGVIKILIRAQFRKHAQGTSTHIDVNDPALEVELSDVPTDPFPPDSSALRRLTIDVTACLQRLTPRQQQIMTMRLADTDHLPHHGEIATSLGISAINVGVQFHQAKQSMKDCLKKKGQPV